ncbi:hypothetical protein [Glycomyces sp. NPDC048151]|uniref:hypothetical protein n=1 Tax=Glycomyces sp. NPDC048151 TaxID=3364002 RepID=UPI0037181D4A
MTDPIAELRTRYRAHTWTPVGIGHSDAHVLVRQNAVHYCRAPLATSVEVLLSGLCM